jgi:hypothetical protein
MLAKQKPFTVQKNSLFEKYPLHTKWTNTSTSWQDKMCERQECLAPSLPMCNELVVERNPAHQ